jgi:hypothetical protein
VGLLVKRIGGLSVLKLVGQRWGTFKKLFMRHGLEECPVETCGGDLRRKFKDTKKSLSNGCRSQSY